MSKSDEELNAIEASVRRGREVLAIAKAFHEVYEDLAPEFGWDTQERSRKDWAEVPPENKQLMLAVVEQLLDMGVIHAG